jgi:mannose-6-phosphate isomerase-like protein (cupin superfamily)
MDSTTLTNGVTTFEPGAAVLLHYHNCDESVTILEGNTSCEIDGEIFQMKAYDSTFVPAGVPHRFWNEGTQLMKILWTYSAIEVTRTIVETGQTAEHLSDADRVVIDR